METELKCPNCGTAAIPRENGDCVCATCGGTFTFKAGEARLKNAGELDKLQADVDELKQRLPASTPAANDPPAGEPNEEEVDAEDEDEDDL
jgi:uncharacterized Zn finger protein (UPF0148 family)